MADCKVLVVGCNHGIQPRDPDAVFGDSDQVKEQKKEFAKLIDTLIQENQIQFVGEEWGPASITIAHAAVDGYNKLPWDNINTTSEELDAMKIPRDYVHGAYSPDQKQQWTRQREPMMLKKLLERKGKAERYIVVCGFEHMEPLAEMLAKTCKSVEMVDYRKQKWYDKEAFAN